MGLFGSKGFNDKSPKPSMADKKLPDSDYRSTIEADDPDFFGKLDKNVSVIIKNESSQDYFIDSGIYICFSGNARHEQLGKMRLLKGDSISAVMMRLSTVLKSALERQNCRAIFVLGLTDKKEVIARRELEEIKELIYSSELLYRRAVGELKTTQVYEQLRKTFVYVIGELPRTDANGMRNLTKKTDIAKFEWIGDDARTSAICYLDKRTARLYNPDKLSSSIRLAELTEAFGSVILEPYSSNWLEFYISETNK